MIELMPVACCAMATPMPAMKMRRIQGAFLCFVVLGLIAIAFLKVFLPETKDYSLEELEERFAEGKYH